MVAPGTHPRFQYELWPGWETIGLPLHPANSLRFPSENNKVKQPPFSRPAVPLTGAHGRGLVRPVVCWCHEKQYKNPSLFQVPLSGCYCFLSDTPSLKWTMRVMVGRAGKTATARIRKMEGDFSAHRLWLLCAKVFILFISLWRPSLFDDFYYWNCMKSGILNVKYKNAGIQW